MKTPKKLEPPKKNPNTQELFVEFSETCSRDYHSEEQWGEWETIKHPSFEKISRNKELLKRWSFDSFKVSDEVFNAPHLYVVWVEYGSGDTFGRSEGNYEIAAITEIPEEALAIQKSIEKGKFDDDHPKSVCSYPSWTGYFESLTAVHVEFAQVMG